MKIFNEEKNIFFTSDSGNATTPAPTQAPTPSKLFKVCKSLSGSKPPYGEIIEIHCEPDIVGRYVTIMKLGAKEEPLTICEVSVENLFHHFKSLKDIFGKTQ